MVKTSTPARLPVRRSANPVKDRLKGLASLLAILAIVGGVPYVLLTFFGPPWPDHAPNRDLLFSELSSESILKILTFFIWVAWLHFVVCLVVEAAAERRGHGLAPSVPLGGGSQTLARRLISGVVLLAGAASVTLPAATAVTTAGLAVPTSVTATQGSGTSTDRSTFVEVEARSKVLSASNHTGVRTNNDQAGQLVKYTEVRLPQGRNYDCLWDIAERYLGEGRRYKEIFDLNKSKLQPDGRRLTNPDLIMPGWQVRLPADAKGPGVHTVKVVLEDSAKPLVKPAAKEANRKPGPSEPTDQSAARGRWLEQQAAEKPSAADIGSAAKDPAAAKEAAAQSSRPGGVAPGAAGEPVQPAAADGPPEDTGVSLAEGGIYGFGATLLAAGLVLGLRRRRGWALGPGPKAASHRQTEVDLRLAADVPLAKFVDNALRHLGANLTQQNRPLPAMVAALVTDKALTMVLAPGESPAPPPPPWQLMAEGRRWTLRRAYAPETDSTAPAPYPTLVTVGRNADGATVLVGLDEAAGIVSFGGITTTARDVVGSLAAEFTTNLWSSGAHVSMVGFGDDLSALSPNRLSYWTSLDEALDKVARRTDAQVEGCERLGVDSVLAARMADPEATIWGPELVFVSAPPSAGQTERLNRLAADPRRCVVGVVVGDVQDAPWRFVVDEKNQAVCRLLGLEVDAHSINPGQFGDLVALFEAAEAEALDKRRADLDRPAYEFSSGDLSKAAAVEVDLLGPVEVDARGEIEDDRRDLSTEIVAFLASQDYGVHPNVLAGSIWPRGISAELRDAALERTRQWLGEDAMYADENGRWVLDRRLVRVDWDVFRTLAKQASTMDDPRGPLSTALSLVHGQAWSDLPPGRYSWLATFGIERRMAELVIDSALKLAEASLRYNDGTTARNALQTGLMFAPASEELWRASLRLASHFGTEADVKAVAGQLYAAVGRYGGPRGAEAETDALVAELLPSYHRPAAVA